MPPTGRINKSKALSSRLAIDSPTGLLLYELFVLLGARRVPSNARLNDANRSEKMVGASFPDHKHSLKSLQHK